MIPSPVSPPTTSRRTLRLLLWLTVAALGLFPWVGESFYVDMVMRMMILGIFAMSLDLLIGFTGLVSFGHAAFFGLGGYMLAIVTPDGGPATIWLALPACLGAAAIAALVIGWFSVRTSGIYFIMITLAFAQMGYYYFNDNTALGGSDGIFIFDRPAVSVAGISLLDLSDSTTFYYLVLASLVGCYGLLKVILAAPFGQVIRAIKTNEARTRALGYHTFRYKLASFVIAGTLAGFAGFLEASLSGIMSPAHLGWHESGLVMMMVILGGMGTLYGPVLGAFALVYLGDLFQERDVVSVLADHHNLLMGVFIIAVVFFLPTGIAGTLERLLGRLDGGAAAATTATEDDGAPPS